jgi:5-hydroxyisourate hydrolase-like protein (transthyretin family)
MPTAVSPTFVPESKPLAAGIYRVRFDVSAYFHEHKTKSFYPYVEVVFELAADGHYHVPLPLEPMGVFDVSGQLRNGEQVTRKSDF